MVTNFLRFFTKIATTVKEKVMNDTEFSNKGYLRLNDFIGKGKLIPVGKSTWWNGVKSGRFPKPVEDHKLGPRITVWRRKDIYDFISS